MDQILVQTNDSRNPKVGGQNKKEDKIKGVRDYEGLFMGLCGSFHGGEREGGGARRQGHVSRRTKITAKPRSHVLACHQPRGGLLLDATQTTPC